MKKQTRTWCFLTLILLLLPPQLKAQKASTANTTTLRAETVTYNNFVYKTDFEDVVKDTYDEEIITINGIRWKCINGIRWKCINAKIESDPLRTIPEGKKALALKAYRSHVNEDGCTTFEMLDDLPEGANKVSFEAVAYGQDGLFTPDGWRFEYSTD